MGRFDITGPIAQVPRTLAMLGDDEIAPFVFRSLIGQPCVIGYPAETVKRFYEEAIERHKEGKFNCIEIAFMLAEQQESHPSQFLMHVADAYKKNMLQFYDPDGSPYPEYVEGVSDPYCRALEYAYTTQDDVNVWLEQWGAQYRLSVTTPRQRTKGERQDKLILQAICDLGYDSQSIPPHSPKHAGVKSQVMKKLHKKHDDFKADTAFDSAWKRLRKAEKIRESD